MFPYLGDGMHLPYASTYGNSCSPALHQLLGLLCAREKHRSRVCATVALCVLAGIRKGRGWSGDVHSPEMDGRVAIG